MSQPLNVRLVCQRGHLISGVSQEGERIIGAEALRDRIIESVSNGVFGSTCSRCGATRDRWRIEIDAMLGDCL